MRTSRRLMLGASILAALIAPASATAAGPDITRVSFEDRYGDTPQFAAPTSRSAGGRRAGVTAGPRTPA